MFVVIEYESLNKKGDWIEFSGKGEVVDLFVWEGFCVRGFELEEMTLVC